MNELAVSVPARLVTTTDASLEQEFEARLRDSSTLAFRVAYSVLRHREDAEDVAQDALVKAHQNLGQLRDREKFRAWLARAAWRLALDRRRGDKRRVTREQVAFEIDPPPAPTSEDAVIADQRRERLWRAIDALPERLRLVVVLASIEEHDIRRVAALVDAPEGTVKSRLFEARKQLREHLR